MHLISPRIDLAQSLGTIQAHQILSSDCREAFLAEIGWMPALSAAFLYVGALLSELEASRAHCTPSGCASDEKITRNTVSIPSHQQAEGQNAAASIHVLHELDDLSMLPLMTASSAKLCKKHQEAP